MKLLLLNDSTAEIKSWSFSGNRLIALVLAMAVILPMIFGVSAFFVSEKIAIKTGLAVADDDFVTLQNRLITQQKKLEATEDYVQNHLNALGVEFGSLQAQTSRINAVQQRIAKSTGVDLSEFDFSKVPGLGGAESSGELVTESELTKAVNDMESELRLRQEEMESINMMLSAITLKKEQTPSGMPIKNGWVSSRFGMRNSPLSGRRQFHKGVDIPGRKNQDIHAVADGVVSASGKKGHYGWMVEINHGDGYSTRYAHNSKNLVKVGDSVKKDQVIAKVGSTGRSTGPHVHFEVKKNGKPINPSKYIK